MRQQLLSEGASELSYEIREIVKKAEQIKSFRKKAEQQSRPKDNSSKTNI